MVFDSHFVLVGILGSAIKSSLSYILESSNPLVSSITINGSSDEDSSRDFSLATGKEWLPSVYRMEGEVPSGEMQ